MTEVLLDDDNAFYAIVGRPRGSFSGYYEDRIGGGGLVARFFSKKGGGEGEERERKLSLFPCLL